MAVALTAVYFEYMPSWRRNLNRNLRIKASKTDPFRSSTTITIGSTSGIICPVRALKTYLSRTSTDHAGPLFCYSNGTPLSRSQFTKELRALLAQGAGINIADYAGHSFRIGAATKAASKGLPHWLIQTLGRWSSDCYLRYIRTPAYVLADVSKRLIAIWDTHTFSVYGDHTHFRSVIVEAIAPVWGRNFTIDLTFSLRNLTNNS